MSVLNIAAVTKESADSGAIGVLESVIHQMADPGYYSINCYDDGVLTNAVYEVEVVKQGGASQVDVDLSELCSSMVGRVCATKLDAVNIGGFLQFFATRPSKGFSAVVTTTEIIHGSPTIIPVYDTKEMSKADIYVLTLIVPGEYEIVNQMNPKEKGLLSISEYDPNNPDLTPIDVSVEDAGFVPRTVSATSIQPIAFRITASKTKDSRIVTTPLAPLAKRGLPIGPGFGPVFPRPHGGDQERYDLLSGRRLPSNQGAGQPKNKPRKR